MTNLKEIQEKVNYDKLFDCVQCGYCLPACPTYETMERETHSPRGRINLVKMVAEGKAEVEDLRNPIEKCLGCMACMTVCPTNVEYNLIFEGAKEVIEDHDVKPAALKKTEDFIFNSLFPSSNWMGSIGNAAWIYQKSGLQKAAQTTHLTALALHAGRFERVMPDLPSPIERILRKRRVLPDYKLRTTVAFFTGCVMDAMFFKTNQNTVELLRLSGAEVLMPKGQTCCGALHSHAGKAESARELAMRNIEAFDLEDVDYIVNNAGGCGAKMTEYPQLFEENTTWHERAKEFAAKVRDISEVLVELDGLTFTQPVQRLVTYQPSCHLTNIRRICDEPRMLLHAVPGILVKELERPDFCCGSAGIYNLVNYDESMKILDLKMMDVKERKTNTIITTNPGCLLQMKLGIERHGLEGEIEAVHLVDLLMEAGPSAK
ncbi:(Fe-S)-binding protein [Halobacillus sp. A5]|uniref:(Fe-S)-binding protein n=1 Tax=Halobacillus sp. A5 TaxID=2880263 RepID=UPI0020A6A007|nr:(Fe-S)-binding protein [Halobacillus sp. A5]MCP3029345.1 (Fe-S)-binding protein [Halobacillus sp. A5]